MVYIILGNGFEEIEAIAPYDILRRGGIDVCYAAVGGDALVTGGHGIKITADALFAQVMPNDADYIVIPGGGGGVNSIKADSDAMTLIKEAAGNGTKLAAICAGPSVLAQLGLLDGKRITCYPGCEGICPGAVCDSSVPVARDGTLITGRSSGAAIEFGLALLCEIAGIEAANAVRDALVC